MSARVVLIALVLLAGCVAAPSFKHHAHTAERQNSRTQRETIDADMMERLAKEHSIIFSGNVIARLINAVLYADRMKVYLDETGHEILRATSSGNVRSTTSDCRTGPAGWAEYRARDQRVVLRGNARLWPDEDVPSGEDIFIYLRRTPSAGAANCAPAGNEVNPRYPLRARLRANMTTHNTLPEFSFEQVGT